LYLYNVYGWFYFYFELYNNGLLLDDILPITHCNKAVEGFRPTFLQFAELLNPKTYHTRPCILLTKEVAIGGTFSNNRESLTD
jgi:hypothetical protein